MSVALNGRPAINCSIARSVAGSPPHSVKVACCAAAAEVLMGRDTAGHGALPLVSVEEC